MREINVAISLHLPNNPGSSIWSNGSVQHAIFLLQLFQKIPYVRNVWLGTYQKPNLEKRWHLDEFSHAIVPMRSVITRVDLLIEMAQPVAASDVEVVRKRGGKFISYRIGNSYAMAVESAIFGANPNWSINPNNLASDAIWTNAQHIRTCKSLFESMYKSKVKVLPHIWSPYFLKQGMKENARSATGWPYAGNEEKVRLNIFEPNLSVVKNALLPFLISSKFYEGHKHKVSNIFIYNALQLKSNATFRRFFLASDAGRERKASVERRYSTVDALGQQGGVVVSHQWENGLNYLYYEVLYGGFPLVHNSPFLKDLGYYYRDFDIVEGVGAVERAVYTHNNNSQTYRDNVAKFLRTIDPSENSVIDAYDAEIRNLFI